MSEEQAVALAAATGGEAWQSGGDIWLVILRRRDGALVIFSGDAVCEYADEAAFEASQARSMIVLGPTLDLG